MDAWIPWAIAAVLLAVLCGLALRSSVAWQQRCEATRRELAEARRELRSRATLLGEIMEAHGIKSWPPR